jgi:hypothetical protein
MANLKVNRGTTYTIGLQYQKDGVDTTLVGATVRFTVKTTEFDASTDDSTAVVEKNVTSGDASGSAEIVLNPADTATLEPLKYYYDIKVEEASGAIYKIDEGRLILDGSPTNRGA